MAAGTVVKAEKDATTAYVAVLVAGTEYQASTPLAKADGTAKSAAELKADLLAQVTAQIAAQQPGRSTLAGLSGAVTV